jgi:WD40 repeat protein
MNNNIQVKKLAEFTGHQNPIYRLIAAPEQGRFFSAGGDKMVVEWNIKDPSIGTPIARLLFTIYSMCICENYLLIGTSEGAIHVINLDTKNEIKYFQITNEGVFDIQYSKEHQLIVASTAKGSLIFIDPKELKILETAQLSNEKIRSIAFNTSRPYLYAACSDTKIYVVDIIKKEKIYEYEAHGWACNVVHYDSKYDHLITASKDAHIRIWDIKKQFEMIKNIPAHNYAIYQMSYNSSSSIYLTAARDKNIKLWNSDFDILLRLDREHYQGHMNSVNSVIWLDENKFISAGDDRRIILWEIIN